MSFSGGHAELATGQDPQCSVRDREPPPVPLVQERRGASPVVLVEDAVALGGCIDRHDPDADEIGHWPASAISAARRRTPSSIWSVARALHDSRIAWLPPPSQVEEAHRRPQHAIVSRRELKQLLIGPDGHGHDGEEAAAGRVPGDRRVAEVTGERGEQGAEIAPVERDLLLRSQRGGCIRRTRARRR